MIEKVVGKRRHEEKLVGGLFLFTSPEQRVVCGGGSRAIDF